MLLWEQLILLKVSPSHGFRLLLDYCGVDIAQSHIIKVAARYILKGMTILYFDDGKHLDFKKILEYTLAVSIHIEARDSSYNPHNK